MTNIPSLLRESCNAICDRSPPSAPGDAEIKAASFPAAV
jgi:hypothetical protein